MTDDLTASAGSSEGSPTSAPSSEDERIKGFQRALSEKDRSEKEAQRHAADLERQLEEIRLSQMSETERSGELNRREQRRVTDQQLEIERLKLRLAHPDVADHYEALLNAPTAEAQALILKGLISPKPPAQPEVPDVDLNNPMRGPDDPIGLPPSLQMDEATADQLIRAYGNRPLRS